MTTKITVIWEIRSTPSYDPISGTVQIVGDGDIDHIKTVFESAMVAMGYHKQTAADAWEEVNEAK